MTITKADLGNTLFDEVGLNKREAKEFVELFFVLDGFPLEDDLHRILGETFFGFDSFF